MTEQRFSKVFWMIYDAAARQPRYISHRGGTRSGKTYSTLQFLNLLIPKADKAGDVSSVVSESLPHLKRGAIRDFENIIGHPLKDDPAWNATDLIFTYPNGAKLEFFSVDSPDKVLGPARKRLFENECNHISYETHRQLAVRTTGLIIMDYNPAAVFWAIEKVENDGRCVCLHTTYQDNKEFLSPEQIAEIERNKTDKNWWQVYGEGKVGTLEGLIYQFEQIDEMPDPTGLRETWGIDFGFTHDPTAIVRVLADTGRKIAYVDEVDYRTGMVNGDIARVLKERNIHRSVHVWADAAEPKSIEEIGAASGCNIRPCDKSAPVRSDRLKFQLLWMQGWTIKVTKRSLNVIKELRNYTWEKDRDGKMTDRPIDTFNHALDAMRYALFSEIAGKEGAGNYVLGFNRNHRR